MASSSVLGVVVLGMRRSGTSAAARLVNLLGFSPGPEDDLMPARPDNPIGYWENASLVAPNDEILAALAGEWSAPPRLHPGWETRSELDPLRPRAQAVAASVLGARRWAWKDPRACLTLPFWLSILGREVAVVVVHRNPLEVAASLQARDGFPVSLGLALWERYVRSTLSAAAGLPVCVTGYEELVADPAAWCGRVSRFLRAHGTEPVAIAAGELDAAVRADLRHAVATAGALATDSAVSPQQLAVAAILEASPTGETFTPPRLPAETPWVDALLDERRQHLLCARELEAANARAEAAHARIATIEASRSYRWLAPLRTPYDLPARRR